MHRSRCLFPLAAALAFSSCGGDDGISRTEPATGEIPAVHVHGLGVNPADQSLFVATHTGLFSAPEGESELTRVRDNYQDTMGFTVVGPDRFLGSGHPDGRTDLPPYLGLIESEDAGGEWDPVSLLGRADFHVLEASGERVYGFGSDFKTQREQFLVSDDGGERWREREPPESLISLAIDPEDPDAILASGRHSLFRSNDGGANWEPVPGGPGLLTWPASNSIYLVDKEGAVSSSGGLETEWTRVGELGGAPAAFEGDGETLYGATHEGAIMESGDGGRTWMQRSSTG